MYWLGAPEVVFKSRQADHVGGWFWGDLCNLGVFGIGRHERHFYF